MIKLGNTILNGTPRIAVSIADTEENRMIELKHVDVLEIRVDQFKNTKIDYIEEIVRERTRTNIPIILTVRNQESEGGKSDISDDDKFKIFEKCISYIDIVDIELTSPILSKVIKLARDNNKQIIVSSHNFINTPSNEELEETLKKAKNAGATIVKIAMQANKMDDVKRLMAFTLAHRNDNIISISLGSMGAITRLTAPSMGSLLTYSYITQQSAPGQLPLSRLQNDLRTYYPEYNQYVIEKYELLEYV